MMRRYAPCDPRPESVSESRVAHADAELEAGKAGLRNLQQGRSDLPPLADQRVDEIDPFDRQVLAQNRPGAASTP